MGSTSSLLLDGLILAARRGWPIKEMHWGFVIPFAALFVGFGIRCCWSAATGRKMLTARDDTELGRLTSGSFGVLAVLWGIAIILERLDWLHPKLTQWTLLPLTILTMVLTVFEYWRAKGSRIW